MTFDAILLVCRSDCFTSQYFKRCLDVLMLREKEELYDEMVAALGKKKKK